MVEDTSSKTMMSDPYYRPFQRSGYHRPFNGYPYLGYPQYPPPYSQQSFPPPFLSKQHFPPIAHPFIFPTRSSSLGRRLSHESSLRIHRHISDPPRFSTSLKKHRRNSLASTQPLAFLSGALSAIRHRPHGWRSGYKPPSRSCFGKHFERLIAPIASTISSCIFTPPLSLNSLMVANPQANLPNIFYDLRNPQIEDDIFLPYLDRLPYTIDFCQLITSPPIHHMTLWHRNLPWHINIQSSQPNGITMYDFFRQFYNQLHQPIVQEDYYTDELAPSDREMLIMAFQIRCAMFPDQLPGNLRRIDFLGREVCFVGLERCRSGKWEFKTKLPPSKERMIID